MSSICVRLLINRFCAVYDCPASHDISGYCFLCNQFFENPIQLRQHQVGNEHARRLAISGPTLLGWCGICRVLAPNTEIGWLVHQSGAQHRQLVHQFNLYNQQLVHQFNLRNRQLVDQFNLYDRQFVPQSNPYNHQQVPQSNHYNHQQVAQSNPYHRQQVHQPSTETRQPARPGKKAKEVFPCGICQKVFTSKAGLKSHQASKPKTHRLKSGAAKAPQHISPAVQSSNTPGYAGPASMGRRRQRTFFQGRFVPGPARAANSSVPYKRRLGQHTLDTAVVIEGTEKERIEKTRTLLPRLLDSTTYARHWHTLIHVEEEQMIRDIETYDLTGVTLCPQRKLFFCKVEVPGLAEKRPSILIDDSVNIRLQYLPAEYYEGRVLVVHQQEVGLAFDQSFIYSPEDLCDVKFTITRIPIRRMHDALDAQFNSPRILFPGPEHVRNRTRPTRLEMASITPFNPLIATNPPQLEAVAAILKRSPSSVPFVVFGPPGTGKTVTIVEAILQLVAQRPSIKILACAPSNSAADLITQRLLSLGTQKLFRLNAPFRNVGDVPAELLPFCCIDDFGRFSVKSAGKLAEYSVVVSTCMSAGIPWGIMMPAGHFAYIFMDEAGQAMEPEAMVSIKTISNVNTNIVLSGDPRQLGPIIRSGVARRLGFGVSYLERLMQRQVYQENVWGGVTVVKLVKNFRSHKAILDFPNDQFYAGKLEVHGNRQVINRFLNSTVLPNPKFPVVFHGVAGMDDRSPVSPSYFNDAEIEVVAEYVEQLLADRGKPTTSSDIGVIAPYLAQSSKLRAHFRSRAHMGLKVGSVEEYQGQERDVIILSTVRTDRERVTYDLRHTLGFLVNPRRLNVAVTRAKSLLIIVGDPIVLSLDPLWRKLLNYIHMNGGWTGRSPNWDTAAKVVDDPEAYVRERQARQDTDMDALMERLMNTVIGEERRVAISGTQDAEEQLDASGDRPWREFH
ncbi:hypothetical protein FRB93_012192 [Tulasnella sp. JGI-2019a]|nr:hypothetical protein FRB93_012192 [Tulasnella sp. JGI-2019a]